MAATLKEIRLYYTADWTQLPVLSLVGCGLTVCPADPGGRPCVCWIPPQRSPLYGRKRGLASEPVIARVWKREQGLKDGIVAVIKGNHYHIFKVQKCNSRVLFIGQRKNVRGS